MSLLRKNVGLVVLAATILFLSNQIATHSLFIAKMASLDSFHLEAPSTNNAHNIAAENHNFSQHKNKSIATLHVAGTQTNDSHLPINVSLFMKRRNNPPINHDPSTMEADDYISECLSPEKRWNTTIKRIGNIQNDPRLSPQYIYQSLLDPWSTNIMNQTMCHARSRFLDFNPQHLSDHDWLVRLMYLGIYLHQHIPAMNELKARHSCHGRMKSEHASNVSNDCDYRCHPNTKYLVVSLPDKGAGATFRTGAVPALLAGLAMGRVVMFVNYRPFGSVTMRSLWRLASIKQCPRGDYQCYFLPITPCVLTEAEVKEAAKPTNFVVLSEGRVQKKFKNKRVVVIDATSAPIELLPSAELRMRKRIYDLVVDYAKKYNVPSHVLEQGLLLLQSSSQHSITPSDDHTSNTTTTNQTEQYTRATSTLHHAALLYVLRPNWEFRQQLKSLVKKAIPKRFTPEWSFGIPIRASDKCQIESTCLTFDQYMQLAVQQYKKYSNQTSNVANIVLTSEAKSMMKARHNYTTSSDFPFRFVVNEHDAVQGTGTPRKYLSKLAHNIMLSTMAAVKLQLMPKYTVVNCCSNFHQMILDMLRSGCGAVARPEFQCLQETDDPQFHVCCQWSPEERCKQAIAELYQRNQA